MLSMLLLLLLPLLLLLRHIVWYFAGTVVCAVAMWSAIEHLMCLLSAYINAAYSVITVADVSVVQQAVHH
jgi:hypothetical protein